MCFVLNKPLSEDRDPDELNLAIDLALFAKYGALPHAGGVLDQNPYHLRLIRAGLRAFNLKEKKDNDEATVKAKAKSRG